MKGKKGSPADRVVKTLAPHLIKKGIIESDSQIEVVGQRRIVIKFDKAFEKARKVVERCHVSILEQYIQQGKGFDYEQTEYYKRLMKYRKVGDSVRTLNPEWFFDLYEKIKTEGLREDRNPVILCDLYECDIKDLGWRWHRANGTHRLAIAKVLGIAKIPVVLVTIQIKGGQDERKD